jgi:hypothetical protein
LERQKRPENVELKALYFLMRVQSFREKCLSEKASATVHPPEVQRFNMKAPRALRLFQSVPGARERAPTEDGGGSDTPNKILYW